MANVSFGDPPQEGMYTSAAEDMFVGRYSESWAGGGAMQVGNTIHARSWDGVTLGTQWEVRCASVGAPPVLIEEQMDETGSGHRTYRTTYVGGEFWLDGDAAWGTGDVEYGGDLAYYSHTTTIQYANNVEVNKITNVQLAGYFDGYGECMQMTIANAAGMGEGSQGKETYPVFLRNDGDCTPDPAMSGEWGVVHSITLIILDCFTSNESLTWGTIKNLYR
jgi:hypothetical protein